MSQRHARAWDVSVSNDVAWVTRVDPYLHRSFTTTQGRGSNEPSLELSRVEVILAREALDVPLEVLSGELLFFFNGPRRELACRDQYGPSARQWRCAGEDKYVVMDEVHMLGILIDGPKRQKYPNDYEENYCKARKAAEPSLRVCHLQFLALNRIPRCQLTIK